jgi:DNA repair protein RadA/Sms
MSDKTHKLSEIAAKKIPRLSTGFSILDKIFGKTVVNGQVMHGLPKDKVILISGAKGAGKSRLCLGISGYISKHGHKVLYFQHEVTQSEFKEWAKPFKFNEDNCYVSGLDTIEEQVNEIRKISPSLVVIDSLNMLHGINKTSQIKNIIKQYKQIAAECETTIILIGFLNKEGITKGNNDIEYLVDVVCHVKPINPKQIPEGSSLAEYRGIFYFSIPNKNRTGPTGDWICFRHNDSGIAYVESSIH